MIDLAQEQVVTLTNAAKFKCLPRRRRGKRPHVGTLYRWATTGVRGVRLETVRVGATLCTSREALQRFFERCTTPDPQFETPNARRKSTDASKKLDDLLN